MRRISIAVTASDGTLYAGSIALGEVFRAAPDATTADKFVGRPADDPQAILIVSR